MILGKKRKLIGFLRKKQYQNNSNKQSSKDTAAMSAGIVPNGIRQLDLRTICAIAGLELPSEYEHFAQTVFSEVCGVANFCKPGCIQFIQNLNEQDCRRSAIRGWEKGAIFFVSHFPVYDPSGNRLPGIVCNRVRGRYAQVCQAIRASKDIVSIAVTGSVGKTSTKDVLAQVLKTQYKTFDNKGNSNGLGPIGHHLQVMPDDTEIFLQEAGMSTKGTVACAGKMIRPDIYVVTNIGTSHIEFYGSQEAILKEKLSVGEYAAEDAKAFLNYDDSLLASAEVKHRVVSFAIDRTDVDYYATDIAEADGVIGFTLVERPRGFRCGGG